MDILLFASVADALARQVVGKRVGLVGSPSPLWIEVGVGRGTLVFILNPDNPVLFFAERPPRGTKERSHFAWVVERHLKGGKIKGVFRCAGDRVMGIVVRVTDRIGRMNTYVLVAEIMGRHSNLVLIDSGGRVVEPLKRVHPDMSRVRHLLPGGEYHPPPPMPKRDPFSLNRESFFEVVAMHCGVDEALRREVSLPGYAVGEVVSRIGERAGPEALLAAWKAWREMMDEISRGEGYLSEDGRLCTPFPVKGMSSSGRPVLEAVELFFEERQRQQALQALRRELTRALKRKLKSLEKAISIERARSLEYAGDEADRYQRWGEVILIHLSRLPKGCQVLEVEDPFEPGETISIPLEEGVPPARTAQGYFNRAAKIRRKQRAALKRLEELERVREFLDSLAWSVESAETTDELRALRRELVREGLMDKGKVTRKKERDASLILPYRVFVTNRGTQILIGRHPKGNEHVTFKVASRFDLWFHARDFPGAHVILRSKSPTDEEIGMAASLAAYFSKARNSPRVEVVYTQRRHVKHPPGSPRGFVLYSDERSLSVRPVIPAGVKEGP